MYQSNQGVRPGAQQESVSHNWIVIITTMQVLSLTFSRFKIKILLLLFLNKLNILFRIDVMQTYYQNLSTKVCRMPDGRKGITGIANLNGLKI